MENDHMEQPKAQKKIFKKALLAVGGLAIIAIIASGTVFVLSHLTVKSSESTQLSPKQQQAKLAKEKLDSAASHEAQGETDAAIASYKEALKAYQAAGDKAGEESVKLQIAYLESVKNNTTNTTTVADPTKDPSYGMQLPR